MTTTKHKPSFRNGNALVPSSHPSKTFNAMKKTTKIILVLLTVLTQAWAYAQRTGVTDPVKPPVQQKSEPVYLTQNQQQARPASSKNNPNLVTINISGSGRSAALALEDALKKAVNQQYLTIKARYKPQIEMLFDEQYRDYVVSYTQKGENNISRDLFSFNYDVVLDNEKMAYDAAEVNKLLQYTRFLGVFYPEDVMKNQGQTMFSLYEYSQKMFRREQAKGMWTTLHESTFAGIAALASFHSELDNLEPTVAGPKRPFNWLRKVSFFTGTDYLLLIEDMEIEKSLNTTSATFTVDLFDAVGHISIDNVTLQGSGINEKTAIENAFNTGFEKLMSSFVMHIINSYRNGQLNGIFFYSYFLDDYNAKLLELERALTLDANYKEVKITNTDSRSLYALEYYTTLPKEKAMEDIRQKARTIGLPLNERGRINRLTWFTPDSRTEVKDLKERERWISEYFFN